MENADKPISPVANEYGHLTHEMHHESNSLSGLSKREYFAGLAMQGILANNDEIPFAENIAKISIKFADELLKQLEK